MFKSILKVIKHNINSLTQQPLDPKGIKVIKESAKAKLPYNKYAAKAWKADVKIVTREEYLDLSTHF